MRKGIKVALQSYLDDPATESLSQFVGPIYLDLANTFSPETEKRVLEAEAESASEQAQDLLINNVLAMQCPADRVALGIVMASRALLLNRSTNLADRLVDKVFPSFVDRALHQLTMRLLWSPDTPDTNLLFEKLIEQRHGSLSKVSPVFLRHAWKRDGPSYNLLQSCLPLLEMVPSKRLQEECLALALRMDDAKLVDEILRQFPSLWQSFDRILPLVNLISKRRTVKYFLNLGNINRFSFLFRAIQNGTEDFLVEMADKSRTIAVVGNSPCEIGKSKGAIIDSFDTVIRFNEYSCEGGFAKDYGSRTTIHARRVKSASSFNEKSLRVGSCLLVGNDTAFLNRSWYHLKTLCSQGVRISAFPEGVYRHLQHQLGSEPSAGLAVCELLFRYRGALPRSSLFGFAFTDQIERGASSHYFADHKPNFVHSWTKEAEYFKGIVRH